MPGRVGTPRGVFTRITSSPYFSWFHPALLVDWFMLYLAHLLVHHIEKRPVFQRDILHYMNPYPERDLSWPHVEHERVPAHRNGPLDQITFYAPIAVFLLVGLGLRRSLHDAHHALLGLWTSRELMRCVVEFIKNRVGRLRPDFFARCAWDVLEQRCTGDAWLIKDGRRSFPSGHSSTAWQGLLFLSLYLAGKNGAFAALRAPARRLTLSLPPPTILTHPIPRFLASLFQSHLLRLAVALAPLSVAVWIPLTRLEDNYHHPTDVLAGSLIGAASALVGYCYYFPAPWRRDGEDGEGDEVELVATGVAARKRGQPRRVYREDEVAPTPGIGEVRLPEEDEEEAVGNGRV
ncbi:hypothetical protein JCM8097_006788 [Rhodosporidiobolus ruineniae]